LSVDSEALVGPKGLTDLPEAQTGDAIRNIDELRPANTTILTLRDFEALKKVLVEGFTAPQLNEYCKKFSDETGEVEKPKYSWILKHSPWRPLDASPLEGPTHKERSVIKLMCNCWKLEIREQVDGIGRLSLNSAFPHHDLFFSR
jgi:hypothetical protein